MSYRTKRHRRPKSPVRVRFIPFRDFLVNVFLQLTHLPSAWAWWSRAKKVYMVGTTNRVNIVPMVMPAAMTMPMSRRLAAPAPEAMISGITPSTMAAVPGDLSLAMQDAVERATGLRPKLDTGGGTSDGRFIAPTGAQVIEFGPRNASIHKIDECVAVKELEQLVDIYLDRTAN